MKKCWKTGASRQSCNEPALHAKGKPRRFSRRGSLEDQFRKGPGPHFLLNLSIDRLTYQRVMFHISSTTRLCFFLSNLIAPRSDAHTFDLQSLMPISYAASR